MTVWLVDKSAFGRLHVAENAPEWAARIERGLVRICTVTRLEIGFSARSATDHRLVTSQPPFASMPVEYLTPTIEDRAMASDSPGCGRLERRAFRVSKVRFGLRERS